MGRDSTYLVWERCHLPIQALPSIYALSSASTDLSDVDSKKVKELLVAGYIVLSLGTWQDFKKLVFFIGIVQHVIDLYTNIFRNGFPGCEYTAQWKNTCLARTRCEFDSYHCNKFLFFVILWYPQETSRITVAVSILKIGEHKPVNV